MPIATITVRNQGKKNIKKKVDTTKVRKYIIWENKELRTILNDKNEN